MNFLASRRGYNTIHLTMEIDYKFGRWDNLDLLIQTTITLSE